jgi:hypothetical protein
VTHRARNNARVPTESRVHRAARVTTAIGFFALVIVLVTISGCTAPATDFVNKITADAKEKCDAGNQIACHTIVQQVSDTKVLVETTLPIEVETPACNAGKQDACQQLAVLHSELSSWCSMGNNEACGAVNTSTWPAKWDEPALVDAAKLACLSGHFKPESRTCQALEMM